MDGSYFHVTSDVAEKSMCTDDTAVPLGALVEYVKSAWGGVVIVGWVAHICAVDEYVA